MPGGEVARWDDPKKRYKKGQKFDEIAWQFEDYAKKAALPLLRKAGQGAGRGAVVNFSSTAGLFGYPYRSAYCAAKCLANGRWDTEKWSMYRKTFETHVVED